MDMDEYLQSSVNVYVIIYTCHNPDADSVNAINKTGPGNFHGQAGFYTTGGPLVKSNLICPLDKLSWQRGCPVLNINIQGNFCISHRHGSSDNLPENLV